MQSRNQIRTTLKLPCTIRLNSRGENAATGFTEELTRDSALVLVAGRSYLDWLRPGAEITISVAAPFAGGHGPKTLECSASVGRTEAEGGRLRVAAAVHKMAFVDRNDIES